MANILTANPWVVDTASATPIFKTYAKLRHIEFNSYAVDADNCVVTDQNGVTIWVGNGNAALEAERSGNIGWVNGVIVPTLTAGKILIYID
jgi:hypothetical protein